ncbi:putative tol protein [Leptodontidium sp. MPI-SDFR-AT-0119]|nr:putative tol protein [Leptodontidium sp. MPI-SDFR-AT-0119]
MDTSSSPSDECSWPVTLCSKCKQMTATIAGLQSLISRDGYRHHCYDDLRASAELACVLCKTLWGFLSSGKLSVEDATGGHLQPIKDYRQIQAVLSARCDLKDSIGFKSTGVHMEVGGRKCHFSRLGHLSRSIKLHSYVDEDEVGSLLPLMYDGVPTLLDTATHSLATSVTSTNVTENTRRQLKECLETHGSNCPSKFDVGLPTRVIDVNSDDNSQRLSLHRRLLRERGQYAALSYCWGDPPHPFVTTADLIQDPSQRDWSQLPATIQDAIRVTRALGLRYLWVDSLCIIQDDESDMMNQIQLMGMIYKNATVTIAAARSPDTPELPDEPLDRRGWTLQESLLSPRILYYGSKDLIWKCRGEPFHSLTTSHTFYRPPLHERLPPAIFNIPSRDAISTDSIWLRIQAAFLSRQFKFSQDRFFALTGVAHELQRVSGDVYIAGLWKSTIMRQLFWKRTDNIVPHVLAQQSLSSPSWSWLAHFRPLVTLAIDENPLDKYYPPLLSWSLNLANESAPLGYVLRGYLRFIGTILKSTDGPHIPFGGAVLTLDWDIPGEDEQDLQKFGSEEFAYLYLGRRGLDQVGPLLCCLVDGSFVRRGLLLVPWHDVWK